LGPWVQPAAKDMMLLDNQLCIPMIPSFRGPYRLEL
jgi:hypothetical protein